MGNSRLLVVDKYGLEVGDPGLENGVGRPDLHPRKERRPKDLGHVRRVHTVGAAGMGRGGG